MDNVFFQMKIHVRIVPMDIMLASMGNAIKILLDAKLTLKMENALSV